MTAATETPTAVQHGVRFRWPDQRKAQTVPCEDLDAALTLMDVLAGQGVTRMEPVTRAVPEWCVDPAGLPAAVRHLAEARADDQLDDDNVDERLAAWLPDRHPMEVAGAFQRLLAAIEENRAAEDGPLGEGADRDQLVIAAEARAVEAVRNVIGGAV